MPRKFKFVLFENLTFATPFWHKKQMGLYQKVEKCIAQPVVSS